tara:strand:+ start:399 stop:1151 length:753 start_codon:yes stop_codon:yes gene_type:complete
MSMGMGLTIPNISNLPGVSRPGSASGSSLLLNSGGINGVIKLPDAFDIVGPAAPQAVVSFWINSVLENPPGHFIFADTNQSSIMSLVGGIYASGEYIQNNFKPSGTPLPPLQFLISDLSEPYKKDKWFNLVMRFNGPNNSIDFFVNGEKQNSTSTQTTNTYTSKYIGNAEGFVAGFKGYITQVSLFKEALSDEEISTILYDDGKPGDISSINPFAWYKLDEGESNVAKDSGYGSNNADISGTFEWSAIYP